MDDVSRVTVSVKSPLAMGPLARAVERDVRAVHADTLVSEVLPMRDQIDATLLAERLVSQLAVGFGALALLLASIGVHGVLSYSVTQRRTELAVRSALGAAPAQLVVSVTRHVFLQFLGGVVIGLLLSVGAVHLARNLLFDVSPASPGIYVIGCVVLLAVALVAAAGPAARAWSISPAENLRRG